MALSKGEKDIITAGPNKGKHGTFDRNAGLVSCYVQLDGNDSAQLFRRGSIKKHTTNTPRPGPAIDRSQEKRDLLNRARRLHRELDEVLKRIETLELEE